MKTVGISVFFILLTIMSFSQIESRSVDTIVYNQFGKSRTIYIKEIGIFENGKLFNGKRDIYRDSTSLSYSMKVINGKFSDTTFNGQLVNKVDSLGRKKGGWIRIGKQCSYDVKDWQEFVDCDVCKLFQYDANGIGDTTVTFNLKGERVLERYSSADLQYWMERTFYPTGFRLCEKYEHKDRTIVFGDFSIVYSKSVRNQPIIKHYDTDVTLIYENGIIVQKESPRFGHKMSMEMPIDFSIPYTIEKGIFENEQLVSGTIEYYDKDENLLRIEQVSNRIK
ncbi:hypothetical protein [Fluviicola taffensis]|uniref:Uncharacterized protein n=1 Tax=Fluviicola taffensis (strain DSM 16823 / NCIMB 13979 / RW262) TaxID=755732 RepID=F2IC58_FLUTR|nr:hypothetical protein [Fluviicola taffensis]AEA43284.1 hypothetical protein Fluta_1289 [Fluviicola taffensis DSM 16823]